MLQALIADTFKATPPVLATMACSKCDGSGKYIGRNGRALGDCFKCAGRGRVANPHAAADREVAGKPGIEVSDEALRAAFDKLRESGLKRISLRMQGFKVKPAKADSRNPGALYVTKDNGDAYLGKIIGGRFQCTAECSTDTAAKVAALIADPMTAIKASGQATGNCAICGLELTDPISLEIGIGPVCLARLA